MFGSSPFIEINDSNFLGGTVDNYSDCIDNLYPSSVGTVGLVVNTIVDYKLYLIIGIIILLVVFIIYIFYNSDKRYSKAITDNFIDGVLGEGMNKNSEEVLNKIKKMKSPTYMDNYIAGTVSLFNKEDPVNAHKYFTKVIDEVKKSSNINNNDTLYVLDKIADYSDLFIDHAELEELDVAEAFTAINNNIANHVEEINKPENLKIKKTFNKVEVDDKGNKKNPVERLVRCVSDRQNVHDSNIYKDIADQIDIVRKNITNDVYKYEDIKKEILESHKLLYDDLESFNMVFSAIEKSGDISYLNGVRERDILELLWNRAHDPRNEKSRDDILTALTDNLKDCIEYKNPVCLTGRITKLWSSLAKLDFNPEIGLLKTKEIIRNEFLNECSKIRDEYLGEDSIIKKQTVTDYENDNMTNDVLELIDEIHCKMDIISQKYSDQMDPEQLSILLESCKSVI